jgi:hypothetical protein
MGANASVEEPQELVDDASQIGHDISQTENHTDSSDTPDRKDSVIDLFTDTSDVKGEKNNIENIGLVDEKALNAPAAIQELEQGEGLQYVDDDATTLHDSPSPKACFNLLDVSSQEASEGFSVDPSLDADDMGLSEVLEKWSKDIMAADEDIIPQRAFAFGHKRNFRSTYPVFSLAGGGKDAQDSDQHVDGSKEVYYDSIEYHTPDDSAVSSQDDVQNVNSKVASELRDTPPSQPLESNVILNGEPGKLGTSFVDGIQSRLLRTEQDDQTVALLPEFKSYAEHAGEGNGKPATRNDPDEAVVSCHDKLPLPGEDITTTTGLCALVETKPSSERDSVQLSDCTTSAVSYEEELQEAGDLLWDPEILHDDSTNLEDKFSPKDGQDTEINVVIPEDGLKAVIPPKNEGQVVMEKSQLEMLKPTANELRNMRFNSILRNRDLVSRFGQMLQYNYDRKHTPHQSCEDAAQNHTIVGLKIEVQQLEHINVQLRNKKKAYRSDLSLAKDKIKVLELKLNEQSGHPSSTEVGKENSESGTKETRLTDEGEREALKSRVALLSELESVCVDDVQEELGLLNALKEACKIMKGIIETLKAEKTLVENKLAASDLARDALSKSLEDKVNELAQLNEEIEKKTSISIPKSEQKLRFDNQGKADLEKQVTDLLSEVKDVRSKLKHREQDGYHLERELAKAREATVRQEKEFAAVERQIVTLKLTAATAIDERLAVQKQLAAVPKKDLEQLANKERELVERNSELVERKNEIAALKTSMADIRKDNSALKAQLTKERQLNGTLGRELGEWRQCGHIQGDLQEKLTAANVTAGRLGNEVGRLRKVARVKNDMTCMINELRPLVEKGYTVQPSIEAAQRQKQLKAVFRRYGY